MNKYYLSIDLGASNLRGVIFEFDGHRLSPAKVIRYANSAVLSSQTAYWDFPYIFRCVEDIIDAACSEFPIESFGIDSWGLDFGLLERDGKLLENPISYRDKRTEGIPERVFDIISPRELYRYTGIQFLQGNTLYQLASLYYKRKEILDRADKLLMMPDLLTFYLTGVSASEYTISSTTQFLDAETKDWNRSLLKKLNLPDQLLSEVIQPGTHAFPLKHQTDSRRKRIKLVTVAAHDTASAVLAVPSNEHDCLYISSGTWSIIGTEIGKPMLGADSFKANFANEGGFGGKIRYCRSLVGLWLVQECVRCWSEQGLELTYQELDAMAMKAPAFRFQFDPQAAKLQEKCNMPLEIARLCRKNNKEAPETPGEFTRAIYECMAWNYRRTIETLEKQLGRSFTEIYIVGGGSRAAFLNQCIADATGRTVVAGASEATAYGNCFAQMYYDNEIASVNSFRKMMHDSQEHLTLYEPHNTAKVEESYCAFLSISAE